MLWALFSLGILQFAFCLTKRAMTELNKLYEGYKKMMVNSNS